MTSPSPAKLRIGAAVLLVVASGALVRVLAARGDLWLDEVWSVVLARQAGTVGRILGSIHHDNNHYLTTLWMHLLGEPSAAWAYRLPSLLAGAGTLLIVALRPLRFGRAESLTAAALLALSPLMVQYDSEARGYAGAACFGVGAFFAFDAFVRTGARRAAAAFSVCSVLALLSHLTTVFLLAGFAAWGGATLAGARESRPRIPVLAAAISIPVLAAAALWVVDVRHLVIGGGPAFSVTGVLGDLLRGLVGAASSPGEWLAAPLVVLAALGWGALARSRDPRAVFFAVAMVAAPAATLSVRRPEFLAARYFLVLVPFLILLASTGLSSLVEGRRRAGLARAFAIAAFAAVAAGPLAGLATVGRGNYSEVVALLRAHTREDVVTVGSDNSFRHGAPLYYHAGLPPEGKDVELVPERSLAATPPRWFLVADSSPVPRAPESVVLESGVRYAFVATFPHAGISGWHTHVFQRVDAGGR